MRGDEAVLVQNYLEESARLAPDKVALVAGNARRTYGEIDADANRLARALVARGVERGDRVVIAGDAGAEVVIAMWATLKAGACFVMLSPGLRREKLAYVLRDSGARAAVISSRVEPTLADAAERAVDLRRVIVFGGRSSRDDARFEAWSDALRGATDDPLPTKSIDQDLAAIIYTSGSTGEPKGVMLTHRNMIAAAWAITTYLGAAFDDVVLCALPLAFDYGLYQVIMAARVGARVVLEAGFAFPAAVLDACVRENVTAFPGVPTMFALLAQMRGLSHDLSAVRYVTNTAAALAPAHIARIRQLFPRARLFSMYGLTECKRCTYLPPEELDRRPGSVGIAIPNTELWLEDEQGNRLAPGQVGELYIRGATVMRGYWNKPEATARRLRPGPLPGENVLRTGDLCRLDEDGFLYFVSRMDDVIKSRGEKVAPKEVENVLYELAYVREAAVIGVPDAVLGQAVKAFIALEPGRSIEPADVILHCKERLEPFMVPKFVEVREALPRTETGKISKVGLA
jgi:amino acid adenylation domain-containing protein